MTKILASLFILAISLSTTICVLHFGWGLEPKSWWWIIGGALFGHGIAAIFKMSINEE